MALTFTGNTGIMKYLSSWMSLVRNLGGLRGTSLPSVSSVQWGSGGPFIRDMGHAFDFIIAATATSYAQYNDTIYSLRNQFLNNVASQMPAWKQFVQNWLVNVVNSDTPLPNLSVSAAIAEMQRQFISQRLTVKANTVTASIAAGGSNIGNPTLLCSVISPDGRTCEFAFAEVLTTTANTDHNSGATAGGETLTIVGTAAEGNKFSQNWPDGSGAQGSVTIVNPILDATSGSGNLLTNSGFDAFTAAVPDHWTVALGASTIDKSASNLHSSYSTLSLKITSDGSTLTSLTQTFNLTAGTSSPLQAQKAYAVNGYLKVSAAPAAGVLTVDLIDGNSAVIADDKGTDNSFTVDLTAQSTSWAAFNGFFRTPTNFPATIKLRLHLTTAVDNATIIYIDDLAMTGPLNQLYVGGPLFAAFRGDTDVIKGDTWSVTLSNTMGAFYGTQTVGLLQSGFELFFDARQNQYGPLPSTTGTPSIPDTILP